MGWNELKQWTIIFWMLVAPIFAVYIGVFYAVGSVVGDADMQKAAIFSGITILAMWPIIGILSVYVGWVVDKWL